MFLYHSFYVLTIAQLERTLTFLANGEIDIELVEEEREFTSNKRKRKPVTITSWKVVLLNGGPLQSFSDLHWGGATRDYMAALNDVPPDAMARIVSEAKVFANRKVKRNVPFETPRSERADLTFR